MCELKHSVLAQENMNAAITRKDDSSNSGIHVFLQEHRVFDEMLQ